MNTNVNQERSSIPNSKLQTPNSKLFKLFRLLATLYFLVFFVVTCVINISLTAVVRVLTGWFDRRLRLTHLVSCYWASIYTWCNPLWSVKIEGREHIDQSKACVMVANHQSLMDIVVLYRLWVHFKWVAKASLFNAPFVGWNLYLNRHIRIARSSVSSQRKMINLCIKTLNRGNSIMVFPEGTRSKTGEMRPLKKGAFHIAKEQKAAIVPIVIDGTARLLSHFPLDRQLIRIHVLPPVSQAEYENMSEDELCRTVESRMRAELTKMRS